MAELVYRVARHGRGWSYFVGPCHAFTFGTEEMALFAAMKAAEAAIRRGHTEVTAAEDGLRVRRVATTTACCRPVPPPVRASAPALSPET